MRQGRMRMACQKLADFRSRAIRLLVLGIGGRQAEQVPGGAVRSFQKGGNCLLVAPEMEESHAANAPDPRRQMGIPPHGGFNVLQRFFWPARVHQEISTVSSDTHVVWIKGNRAVEMLTRKLELVLLQEDISE